MPAIVDSGIVESCEPDMSPPRYGSRAHGASSSDSSKSLSARSISRKTPARRSALVCASYFLCDSVLILPRATTGLEMFWRAVAFFSRATRSRRWYSAWWRCWVNSLAVSMNSSSTIIQMSSAAYPSRIHLAQVNRRTEVGGRGVGGGILLSRRLRRRRGRGRSSCK